MLRLLFAEFENLRLVKAPGKAPGNLPKQSHSGRLPLGINAALVASEGATCWREKMKLGGSGS